MDVWNRIFNEENFHESPFYGSVHDYFHAQSGGLFSPVFDLHYVALVEGHAKYRSTRDDDENSQFLVQDIVDELLTRSVDWSLYDWDNDGYINQLLIVYAGKGSSYGGFGGDSNAIWPHQYCLSWHTDPATGSPCSPRSVSYGGKEYKVDSYCAVQELTDRNDYGTFGTICHEYTHCLGFPDFYGTSDSPRKWDLMDYGNNNLDGFCPPNYSAHERWLMGWLSPTELTTGQTVGNMDTSQAYLIRNDGYSDEYYIVENRQQTGWDQSLPGSGVVVFHIDYDESVWRGTSSEYANTSRKKRYVIIPANNQSSYRNSDGWAYPYLTNDSLTNYSSPAATLNNANTDGSKLMNKSLRDIRVENGLASFRFTVDTKTGITELPASRQSQILYDLGPIYIIRYANGDIKKVMKR